MMWDEISWLDWYWQMILKLQDRAYSEFPMSYQEEFRETKGIAGFTADDLGVA